MSVGSFHFYHFLPCSCQAIEVRDTCYLPSSKETGVISPDPPPPHTPNLFISCSLLFPSLLTYCPSSPHILSLSPTPHTLSLSAFPSCPLFMSLLLPPPPPPPPPPHPTTSAQINAQCPTLQKKSKTANTPFRRVQGDVQVDSKVADNSFEAKVRNYIPMLQQTVFTGCFTKLSSNCASGPGYASVLWWWQFCDLYQPLETYL